MVIFEILFWWLGRGWGLFVCIGVCWLDFRRRIPDRDGGTSRSRA